MTAKFMTKAEVLEELHRLRSDLDALKSSRTKPPALPFGFAASGVMLRGDVHCGTYTHAYPWLWSKWSLGSEVGRKQKWTFLCDVGPTRVDSVVALGFARIVDVTLGDRCYRAEYGDSDGGLAVWVGRVLDVGFQFSVSIERYW